jgi:replicative DNA helicase
MNDSAIDTERAILGAVLMRPEHIAEVSVDLTPADFLDPAHRAIFAAMLRLDAGGHRIETVAVAAEAQLASDEVLVAALQTVVTTANLGYYVKRLASRARRARWQAALVRIAASAGDASIPDSEFFQGMDDAMAKIEVVTKRNRSLATMREAMTAVQRRMEDKVAGDRKSGALAAMLLGHEPIDIAIGGLRPGNLVVIAGRPGSGKTSLGVQAMMQGNPEIGWLVFSAEMDRYELAERVFQSEGLDMRAARSGTMTLKDWTTAQQTLSRHCDPIRAWIDDMGDEGSMSVPEIRAAARYWRAKQGAHLKHFGIIIDYFQLLKISNKFRREGLDQASRDLKSLAKVMQCPIVLISQLNREMEKEERRPRLSDLRECGQLEADADVVLFTYRPEQHTTNDGDADALRGKAELIIAKNRHGNTGIVYAKFDGARSRFEQLSPGDENNGPSPKQQPNRKANHRRRGGFTTPPEDSE